MAAFTAIAAATAATVSAGAGVANFLQAGKQRKLAEKARMESIKAFEEADKMLDVNYMEAVGLSKEPYERQREQLSQQAAQAMEAGKEAGRGASATAGRVLAQSQRLGQDISSQQTRDLEAIQKKILSEEARLRDKKAGLRLQASQGAGAAAMQAEALAQKNTQAGAEAFGDVLSSLTSEAMIPLYRRGQGEADINVDSNYDFNIPGVTNYQVSPQQFDEVVSQGNTRQDNQVILDPSQGYNIFAQ